MGTPVELTFEQLVAKATQNKANVELLCDMMSDGRAAFGVRIRFWGPPLKGMMVLGEGDTFRDAMDQAVTKARTGRVEALDFAARPWSRPASGVAGW